MRWEYKWSRPYEYYVSIIKWAVEMSGLLKFILSKYYWASENIESVFVEEVNVMTTRVAK
jgi:hypothetical protein